MRNALPTIPLEHLHHLSKRVHQQIWPMGTLLHTLPHSTGWIPRVCPSHMVSQACRSERAERCAEQTKLVGVRVCGGQGEGTDKFREIFKADQTLGEGLNFGDAPTIHFRCQLPSSALEAFLFKDGGYTLFTGFLRTISHLCVYAKFLHRRKHTCCPKRKPTSRSTSVSWNQRILASFNILIIEGMVVFR